MEKWIQRIANAIKANKFSFEYGSRLWHGVLICVEPLFCSYGKIGYTIAINDGIDGTLKYDYELETLKLNTPEGESINLWSE